MVLVDNMGDLLQVCLVLEIGSWSMDHGKVVDAVVNQGGRGHTRLIIIFFASSSTLFKLRDMN